MLCVSTACRKNEQRLLWHTTHHHCQGLSPVVTVIPVDYRVWSIMQEPVYRKPKLDVADLKWCLTAAWSGLQQHVIDMATDQRHVRLCTCGRIYAKNCFDNMNSPSMHYSWRYSIVIWHDHWTLIRTLHIWCCTVLNWTIRCKNVC